MTRAIAQYDRLARDYDRRWRRYTEETVGYAVRCLEGPAPSRVLDVACGTGALIVRLRQRWPQAVIVGVDGSAAMLRQATAACTATPGVAFCRGWADALPVASGRFDLVCCLNAFHYFPRPDVALREFHRALRPGGRLLLLDWCRDPWYGRLANRWLRLTDPGHVRMHTQREWRRLLDAERFTVERLERFRAPWCFGWRWWPMMACVARAA